MPRKLCDSWVVLHGGGKVQGTSVNISEGLGGLSLFLTLSIFFQLFFFSSVFFLSSCLFFPLFFFSLALCLPHIHMRKALHPRVPLLCVDLLFCLLRCYVVYMTNPIIFQRMFLSDLSFCLYHFSHNSCPFL